MTSYQLATPKDYYSVGDFGFGDTVLVGPIMLAEMITLPEVWDQIGTSLLLSTLVYGIVGTILFLVPGTLPGSVIAFSLYAHSLVVMLKNLELSDVVNMKELITLEAQGEDLWRYMLVFDISFAISAATIMGVIVIALWGKYVLGTGS